MILKGIIQDHKNNWIPTNPNIVKDNYVELMSGNGQYVMYQVLIGSNDLSKAASVLGNVPITSQTQNECDTLTFRWFAVYNGRVILPEHQKLDASHFAFYLQSQQLSDTNSINNSVFVGNPSDIVRTFSQLKGSDYVIDCYRLSPIIKKVAESLSVCLSGPDLNALNQSFILDNKTNFRDFIDSEVGSNNFPRLKLDQTRFRKTKEEITKALIELLKFSNNYNLQLEYSLFIQYCIGAGGYGNFKVDHDFSIHSSEGSEELHSFEGLVNWVYRQNEPLEINTYLKIDEALSYGLIVNNNFIGVIGPRYQRLDKHQSYYGFEVRIEEETPERTQELEYCIAIAKHLYELGFRGPCGIDLYRYICPQENTSKLRASEINLRRDATSPCLTLFLKTWGQEVLNKQVVFGQNDHFIIRGSWNSTSELIEAIRNKKGLTLTNKSNPYGITLITPPLFLGKDQSMIAVAFSGRSLSEKQEIEYMFTKTFG